MSQSSCGQTSVRLPCWMFTIPSIARACTVSRATVRLTPYCVTSSSDDGNASPGPIRPDTISAASSVESCWLSRWGSRRPGSRRGAAPSPDTDTVRHEAETAEMPFEQRPRASAERTRGRAQTLVLEHAALHEYVLRASVVVVDRMLHLENQHGEDLPEALVRERSLTADFGLVHPNEQIDEVDAGDDPSRAAADAIEQVHPAVSAPDPVLAPEMVEPVAHLGRSGLELHEPHVLDRGAHALHHTGPE